MPSLNTEQISVSTGRRGRSKLNEREERDVREDHEIAAAYTPDHAAPLGQQCSRCGEFSEKNTSIFRAYGLVVDKCMKCRNVWIEGDPGYVFDILTAASGVLLRRAEAVYLVKHPAGPPAVAPKTNLEEALASDWGDPRWTTE